MDPVEKRIATTDRIELSTGRSYQLVCPNEYHISLEVYASRTERLPDAQLVLQLSDGRRLPVRSDGQGRLLRRGVPAGVHRLERPGHGTVLVPATPEQDEHLPVLLP